MAVFKVDLAVSRDVTVPAHAANLLMDSGDGFAALLYIYILSHSGELDISAAAARLKTSEDEVLRGFDKLKAYGLVGGESSPSVHERSDELPEYSRSDVAEYLGSDPEFKFISQFCEEKLGKILSNVDLQTLLGIYSWLGLPSDVICLLITSCVMETKKKYGEGRKPTMRTIEKTAKVWVREGILTSGRAEEYLEEQEKLGSDKMHLASLLGIQKRTLAPTEDRYISEWLRLELSDELILLAFDKTVTNTGSLRWAYMDKIVKSFHEQGFKTADDARRGERKPVPAEQNTLDTGAASRLRELNRRNKERR